MQNLPVLTPLCLTVIHTVLPPDAQGNGKRPTPLSNCRRTEENPPSLYRRQNGTPVYLNLPRGATLGAQYSNWLPPDW